MVWHCHVLPLKAQFLAHYHINKRAKNCRFCLAIFKHANLGKWNTLYTSHLKWNGTDETLFLTYRPQTKCIQPIFRTTEARVGFQQNSLKISKITHTANRFSLLTSIKSVATIKRVSLQRNKEFIVFIFYLMDLSRRVILKNVWYARHLMFMNNWKQTSKRLKLHETTKTQWKK